MLKCLPLDKASSMKVEEPKPEDFDKIVDYWKSTAQENLKQLRSWILRML
jgi:cephalosporin-C deacetylase-like acetyl esterase